MDRASLRVRWFETGDFSVHYLEEYEEGRQWECRWDRHPNEHNTRAHVHAPPDAETPGRDASFADDWRAVLETVLEELDDRVESLWQ